MISSHHFKSATVGSVLWILLLAANTTWEHVAKLLLNCLANRQNSTQKVFKNCLFPIVHLSIFCSSFYLSVFHFFYFNPQLCLYYHLMTCVMTFFHILTSCLVTKKKIKVILILFSVKHKTFTLRKEDSD